VAGLGAVEPKENMVKGDVECVVGGLVMGWVMKLSTGT
jgi:hypothetical protein